VTVPSVEIYSTLQRGVVDAAIYNWPSALNFKLYEVCDYAIQVGSGIAAFAPLSTIISPDWLHKLPPDLKKVVYGAFRESGFGASYSYFKNEKKAMEEWKKRGLEITRLGEKEVSRWKEALKPIEEEWVKEMEDKGLPGRKLLKEMQALNKKYKHLTGEEILELQRSRPVSMDEVW
jgi:TRAP-type C4-dicarboxylate transport system substrate-binding protein